MTRLTYTPPVGPDPIFGVDVPRRDIPGLDILHPTDRNLHACKSGQCDRWVSIGCAYCCGACSHAWEATPRYEPHRHTESCEARFAERGPRRMYP